MQSMQSNYVYCTHYGGKLHTKSSGYIWFSLSTLQFHFPTSHTMFTTTKAFKGIMFTVKPTTDNYLFQFSKENLRTK